MDCPTGLLIDFSLESLQVPFGNFVTPMKSCDPFMDDCFGKELPENVGASMQQKDHHSPTCERLVDLDFSETSPHNDKVLEENLAIPLETEVQYCKEGSLLSGSNGFRSELFSSSCNELSPYFSKRFRDHGSTRFIKDCKKGISWSPAKCSDMDLLENEKFDFNMPVSPCRGLVDESPAEGRDLCIKCCCKNDKGSNSQKSWSMLSATFAPELSEEASEIVVQSSGAWRDRKTAATSLDFSLSSSSRLSNERCLTASSPRKEQTEFDVLHAEPEIPERISLDSESRPSSPEEQDKNCNAAASEIQELMEGIVLDSETQASQYSKSESKNSSTDGSSHSISGIEQCVSRSFSPRSVVDFNSNVTGDKTNSPSSADDIDISEDMASLAADFVKKGPNSDSGKSSFVGSKSDVIILISDDDKENSRMPKIDLALEDKLLSQDQNEYADVLLVERATSPLIRKDTFTVKSSPLRETNFKTPEINCDNQSLPGIKSGLKKQGRKSLVSSKFQPSTPVSSQCSTRAFKADPSSQQKCSLFRKDTFKVSPVCSVKETRCRPKSTPGISNYSTPIKRLNKKPSSVVSNETSPSSKKTAFKSNVSAPPPLKQKKSPKGTISNSSSTPKKHGVLPSRLNIGFRESLNTSVSATETVKMNTPKSSSNLLSKMSASSIINGSLKRFPAVQESVCKPRGNGTSGAELSKRNFAPLKAVDPLSHMVKAAVVPNSPAARRASCIGTSLGKTLPSTPRINPRASNVCGTPSAIRKSSSVSTPKCTSTPIKSRFLSQSKTPTTPVSIKKAGPRRHSLLPTPTKNYTPTRFSEKF